MKDSEFQSTVAYLRPSQGRAVPALEQLRMLQQEALDQGRSKDAAEFGQMMNLMARHHGPVGATTAMKAVMAAFLALLLVVSIHFFMA